MEIVQDKFLNPVKNRYILTAKEWRKVLDYVQNEAKKKRRKNCGRRAKTNELMVLILNRGLSGEELRRLNIEDLPCHHGEPYIIVHNRWDTKTREVYLLDSLETKINEYVQKYRQGARPKDPFFITENRTRTSCNNLYKKFHGDKKSGHLGIAGRLGIEHLSPCVFRRTAKYQLAGRVRTTKEKTLSSKVWITTLEDFLRKHLRKKLPDERIASLKKCLQNADNRGKIELPKPVGDWEEKQLKYYKVMELRRRWPGYQYKLKYLPNLISRNSKAYRELEKPT